MHTATDWSEPAGRFPARARAVLERSRDWLDDRGKAAWVLAIVAGFFLFWPLGLALLAYTIWSNRMCNRKSWRRQPREMRSYSGETGNAAFDTYRTETLKRLEDERSAFTAFLEQLRAAKDQAEFDQFMSSRQQAS